MSQHLDRRTTTQRHDPRLTVLPSISAPIDEGMLLPGPPPSLWSRLVRLCVFALLAGAVLTFAFLHATPMR